LTRTPPPGQVRTPFQLLRRPICPKSTWGVERDSIHQVDIDIGGPFATRWAQVAPGEFSGAPTWWSRPAQKKLSNVPLLVAPSKCSLQGYFNWEGGDLNGAISKMSRVAVSFGWLERYAKYILNRQCQNSPHQIPPHFEPRLEALI
jgi:hypothetical protein